MSMRLTIFSVVVIAMASTTVRADDVTGAAKAFSQAQEMMLTGDYARAANLYELADELAPSAPALRNAARARLAAKHEARAATLAAELLQRYPSDTESRAVAEAILSKLSPQLAQFDITCDEECAIAVDGKAASAKPRTRHVFFVQPGARKVTATFEDERQATQQITAQPGKMTRLELHAPPKPVKPTPVVPLGAAGQAGHGPGAVAQPHHGISRAWFIGGAVLTAGLGVAAGIEGMATLHTRDQIKAAVAAHDDAHAQSLYDTGVTQQLRTNILIGATVAMGATAIVLATMTNWSGSSHEHQIAVAPTTGGATLVFGGRF